MVMYIVLGSLVGIVAIFLIVTSVLDKKKRKKLIEKKKQLEEDSKVAGTKVSEAIVKVIELNKIELNNFVPSVGVKKMSDINNEAKSGLQKIKKSKFFQLIQKSETEGEAFVENMDLLFKEKSNNWSKRNIKNIDFFKNYKPEVLKEEPKKNKKNKIKSSKKNKLEGTKDESAK